jgi:hypothetical protein
MFCKPIPEAQNEKTGGLIQKLRRNRILSRRCGI